MSVWLWLKDLLPVAARWTFSWQGWGQGFYVIIEAS
jgi:hypothetical protein